MEPLPILSRAGSEVIVRGVRTFLFTLVFVLSAQTVFAKGMGCEAGHNAYGVQFTGTLAPFQASGSEHIRILEEKLAIDLRRTEAVVDVRYTFRNLADHPVKVAFGFPVEATEAYGELAYDLSADCALDDAFSPTDSTDLADHNGERRQDLKAAIPHLKEYAITFEGQPIRAKFTIRPFTNEEKIQPFPALKPLKYIAGWMVSEAVFPASAQVTVEIRYTAVYFQHAGFYDSPDRETTEVSPASFVYLLSTGAGWNGPIEKGSITVRADGIPSSEVAFAGSKNRFRHQDGEWVWAFHDLEPNPADDIVIHAIPGYCEYMPGYAVDASYIERTGKCGAPHQRFKIKASSTLAPMHGHTFGPEHLAESDPEDPWAEGVKGPGIGEWVEIEPIEPRPLLAIKVYPGFQFFEGDERLACFKEYGRPARVEIVLNDEHRFVATLGDYSDLGGIRQRIPIEAQLIPIVGYAKPVSKIRMTLLEVYPGSRFEDTCITKLVLYDLLPEKPDFKTDWTSFFGAASSLFLIGSGTT